MKHRYLSSWIEDLCFSRQKMAFVSGPRQCGKTTMAKMMLKEHGLGNYFNWDETQFRKIWTKDPKGIFAHHGVDSKFLIVLDEIHKAKFWKRSLKGVYDTADPKPNILVTGSARLNVYNKGSDSLMGRYYHFRLHPFTLGELERSQLIHPDDLIKTIFERSKTTSKSRESTLKQLLKYSGFPEPFLAQDERIARLWRKGRVEKVIREDLRDLTRIPELSQIEMLVALLPERVGSFVSRASLRVDLEVSFDTVRRWLNYLKELYYIFEVKPYHTRIKQSLRKEGKSYLWDYTEIDNDAIRFENLVACHLLKFCHFWTDVGEGDFELFCLRNKQQQEIDFLICRDGRPWLPVEVKLNETDVSANWVPFLNQLPCKQGLQIVLKPQQWQKHAHRDKDVLVASASDVLQYFV